MHLTQVYPAQWMENHLDQLHLNTWIFPAFNQPIQLNIDRKLTEMMIYSGVSYFFWECMEKTQKSKKRVPYESCIGMSSKIALQHSSFLRSVERVIIDSEHNKAGR